MLESRRRHYRITNFISSSASLKSIIKSQIIHISFLEAQVTEQRRTVRRLPWGPTSYSATSSRLELAQDEALMELGQSMAENGTIPPSATAYRPPSPSPDEIPTAQQTHGDNATSSQDSFRTRPSVNSTETEGSTATSLDQPILKYPAANSHEKLSVYGYAILPDKTLRLTSAVCDPRRKGNHISMAKVERMGLSVADRGDAVFLQTGNQSFPIRDAVGTVSFDWQYAVEPPRCQEMKCVVYEKQKPGLVFGESAHISSLNGGRSSRPASMP